MIIEIELHDSTELPRRHDPKNKYNPMSVPVYAMDESCFPAALAYNYRTSEWEELDGNDFDDTIDFKWFYVPDGLGVKS